MRKRTRRKSGELPVSLNMTTMVDVLFQLLIFFLVLSELKKSSVLIELPEVSKQEAQQEAPGSPKNPLVITIDAKNALYFDDKPIDSIDALKPLLEEKKKGLSDADKATVVIRTDQESRGAKLVEVVSVLSQVGFRSVTFDVSEKSQP